MNKTFNSYYAAALIPLLVLGFASEHAFADRGDIYGPAVDEFCFGYDGSKPYEANGCGLCHNNDTASQSNYTNYVIGRPTDYAPLCTGTPTPQPNQAPNGRITNLSNDNTITAGESLEIQGNGTDPDGDSLNFSWNFSGATGERTDPGNVAGQEKYTVTFPNPGDFTIQLTVFDGQLYDLTPAELVITVNPVCTDSDGDGFCQADDCNDSDPGINPNVTEICDDGIDNNCNDLIDRMDPMAINCSGGCPDADGDLFSPNGGTCGPIDCDDADPEVNPGMHESCGDGFDNDCDQLIDGADAECNGSDCIGDLLNGGGSSFALQLSLDADRDPAVALDGSLVSDHIYVFIPSEPGIVQVRYYLNDQLRQTENYAPWDFAGGNASSANPFDTLDLGNGWHEILAEIDLDTGETMAAVASFEVDNGLDLTIDISEASWDAGDRELEVEGTWPTNGALVTVSNADTGEVLGSTRVEYDDGQLGWEFERERLSVVPCRVRVEIEGEFGEADVANAPSDCEDGDGGGGGGGNQPPVAMEDSVVVDEDGSVSIDVLANDSDPDVGDVVRLVSATQGAAGSVQINDAKIVYRPNPNVAGTDSFTYKVEDGRGGTDSARVKVTIRPVNDAPVAVDDSGATDAGVALTINVLANDSDVDGGSLRVSGVGQATNGSVSSNGANVTYTPRSGFDGSDSFTYTVADGNGGSDTARVTVTVRPLAPPQTIRVEIDEAKWNSRRRRLEVEGEDAPRGARVTVFNANTGQQLGTTTVESDGEWEVRVRRPSVVPCRVRVDIRNGDAFGSAERNVSRAPSNCR